MNKKKDGVSTLNLQIITDTSNISPLLDQIKSRIEDYSAVERSCLKKAFKLLLDSGDLFSEITTLQVDGDSTSASNLLVTFYPTDSFLVFFRAVLAGDIETLNNGGFGRWYEKNKTWIEKNLQRYLDGRE